MFLLAQLEKKHQGYIEGTFSHGVLQPTWVRSTARSDFDTDQHDNPEPEVVQLSALQYCPSGNIISGSETRSQQQHQQQAVAWTSDSQVQALPSGL